MLMVTWNALKSTKIPMWEVLVAMAVLVGATWGAFTWADELEDTQITTQRQLDQLVLLVVTTTRDNQAVHKSADTQLIEHRHALELLKQEIELRRELEPE